MLFFLLCSSLSVSHRLRVHVHERGSQCYMSSVQDAEQTRNLSNYKYNLKIKNVFKHVFKNSKMKMLVSALVTWAILTNAYRSGLLWLWLWLICFQKYTLSKFILTGWSNTLASSKTAACKNTALDWIKITGETVIAQNVKMVKTKMHKIWPECFHFGYGTVFY